MMRQIAQPARGPAVEFAASVMSDTLGLLGSLSIPGCSFHTASQTQKMQYALRRKCAIIIITHMLGRTNIRMRSMNARPCLRSRRGCQLKKTRRATAAYAPHNAGIGCSTVPGKTKLKLFFCNPVYGNYVLSYLNSWSSKQFCNEIRKAAQRTVRKMLQKSSRLT